MVDDILARAVKGMVSILLDNGDINVDFADVRTIMSHRGLALMGVGSASGENAIEEALSNAIESPLLDGMDIKGAKGVILHLKQVLIALCLKFQQQQIVYKKLLMKMLRLFLVLLQMIAWKIELK